MARGLPRDTENNPDHSEILLDFLSAVFMSAFSHYFKDFVIVYYVTMAPYNSKSSSRYDVCLCALVLTYFLRAPGLFNVRQVHTSEFILSSAFPWFCCMLLIFLDVR